MARIEKGQPAETESAQPTGQLVDFDHLRRSSARLWLHAESVQEGSHQVGGDYFGNFVVEGTGTHKWTIEILNDGMNLVED